MDTVVVIPVKTPKVIRPWSPEEDQKLKELVAEGKGKKAISIELKKNYPNVSRRIKKLGLPIVNERRLDANQRYIQSISFFKEGKTVGEIANLLHIKSTTVESYLSREGLLYRSAGSSQAELAISPRRGQKWTLEEEELVTQMFQNGQTVESIARSQCRTVLGINHRLVKLRLIETLEN